MISDVPGNRYLFFWKRIFDFSAACVALLISAIPMGIVALAIFACAGWPVIFSQKRVGRNGREFYIKKFRTMRVQRNQGTTVTVSDDPRIFPLGKLLRKLKLDELPQFWNVLIGDMSLVGPRPDVPGFADKVQGDARRILSIRPGITGPATLAFRNEEGLLSGVIDPVRYNQEIIFPRKVMLNLEYIDSCSFWVDLCCLWKTAFPDRKG